MVQILVLLVISIGLALAAYALRPRTPGTNFTRDDKPTTLAIRGAYSPYLIGRRRVGAVFGWAGNRNIVPESLGSGGKGGGGGSSATQDIYYEDGWHQLCPGPAYRLHKIWMDGAVIFTGPIDRNSHPSGSTIDIGKEGAFQIYWGEIDQPVNTYLGDSSRVGISSRWPHMCYVLWRQKRLGAQARWALIDYDIEVRIVAGGETVSGSPWIESTRALSEDDFDIDSFTAGAPGTAKIRIAGNHQAEFVVGGFLKIADNSTAAVNRDFGIRSVVYVPRQPIYDDVDFWGYPIHVLTGYDPDHTDVYLSYAVAAASNDGTATPYISNEDDGVNPAHAVSRLLFEPWPHGMDLDPDDFDLTTLDDLAQLCIDENIPVSVFCQDGETAVNLLGTIMQDVGFGISWDVNRGQYVFRAARKELSSNVALVTKDMLLPPNPEINITHGVRPVDKMVFTFSDRETNFRDNTITVDDDTQADFLGQQRPQKIGIPSAISFEVANRISERRFQEGLGGGSTMRFTMSREARALVPGQVISVEGYPGAYRIERTEIDPTSGKVVVEAFGDVYGAEVSAFELEPGVGPNPSVSIPEPDLAAAVFEVPSHVSPGVQQLIVARIRANMQTKGADIYISRDDSTYSHMGEDKSPYTGGTLTAEFAAGSKYNLAQGPTIQALGPDIANVLDLSGDEISWRAGRQFALIDREIFYLQKVTALGGGLYRLDGLLRARFDTTQETHAADAPVFIFKNDVFRVEDILLAPRVTLFTKPSPKATASIPLSQIPPIETFLIGKGIAPMDIPTLRAGGREGSNAWTTGADVTIKWSYRSTKTPRTGAGLQGAGSPCGRSDPEGTFVLTIMTVGEVVKRTVTLTENKYVYDNADLVADFGSEPAAFLAEVVNVNAGFSSLIPRRITVTKN